MEQTGPSAYLTRLTNDAQIASEFVPDVLVGYMMQEIAMMVLRIALMFTMSRQLTALFCIVVPVLLLIIIKAPAASGSRFNTRWPARRTTAAS